MKNNRCFFFQMLFICLFFSFAAEAQTADKTIDKTVEKTAAKLFKSIEVVDFSGEASDDVFAGDAWQFFGPTRQITVTDKQKIVGSGAAVFGTSSGASRVAVSLCYLKKGSNIVSSLAENNHLIADADAHRRTFAVSVAAELPAGTYAVGYCVNNRGPQTLNNNNYVNGWILIVN